MYHLKALSTFLWFNMFNESQTLEKIVECTTLMSLVFQIIYKVSESSVELQNFVLAII